MSSATAMYTSAAEPGKIPAQPPPSFVSAAPKQKKSKADSTSINLGSALMDDFAFSSNVASCAVYVRLGFLRKVYALLSTQLLTTMLIAGAMMMHSDVLKVWLRSNTWVLLLCFVASIGLIIGLHVKARETPMNYYLFFGFTVVESITIGFVVVHYSVSTVLEALALTLAVTMALTVYTLQSKRDFSSWGAALFAAVWVLLLAGILQMFLQSSMLELGIAVGGALLFSLFIIFDTHMLMARHSPEDYMVATVALYLDIINLFLYILRILAVLKRD